MDTVAVYFPSYHRDPLNDRWYGEGWSEWTQGCQLLPDQWHGKGYLEALAAELGHFNERRS